jgi:DNA-binding FadR family transcriptional regulator
MMESRDGQLVGITYSQIRSTLLVIWRSGMKRCAKIGVMNYIQRRTRISRSVVAEVLAALRQGNYINMSRGKLVSINHLPAEY